MLKKKAVSRKTSKSCGLRARKSRFVQIFRTTPAKTVCPNFYVLAHANGCTFQPRCSYCYLKSSFWFLKGEQAFTNVGRMKEEVRRWIAKDKLESYVLNTGNLSDSLAFEAVRPLIGDMIETFRVHAAGKPHTLLLVTKGGTKECACLFEREPCANVTVSFSVNSPEAAKALERGAAPVADRFRAARRLKAMGWRVRIRIDPMVLGYSYEATVEKVRALGPERITLGTLRAESNLDRYVGKGLFADLVEQEGKGLARYPRETRLAIYRVAVDRLRGTAPIGLCEETYDIWDALGLDTASKSCNCGG